VRSLSKTQGMGMRECERATGDAKNSVKSVGGLTGAGSRSSRSALMIGRDTRVRAWTEAWASEREGVRVSTAQRHGEKEAHHERGHDCSASKTVRDGTQDGGVCWWRECEGNDRWCDQARERSGDTSAAVGLWAMAKAARGERHCFGFCGRPFGCLSSPTPTTCGRSGGWGGCLQKARHRRANAHDCARVAASTLTLAPRVPSLSMRALCEWEREEHAAFPKCVLALRGMKWGQEAVGCGRGKEL
jgi:hypothetical protein